jgi:hypothetical protein
MAEGGGLPTKLGEEEANKFAELVAMRVNTYERHCYERFSLAAGVVVPKGDAQKGMNPEALLKYRECFFESPQR